MSLSGHLLITSWTSRKCISHWSEVVVPPALNPAGMSPSGQEESFLLHCLNCSLTASLQVQSSPPKSAAQQSLKTGKGLQSNSGRLLLRICFRCHPRSPYPFTACTPGQVTLSQCFLIFEKKWKLEIVTSTEGLPGLAKAGGNNSSLCLSCLLSCLEQAHCFQWEFLV